MRFKIFKSNILKSKNLEKVIIDIDRENVSAILSSMGDPFDAEMRFRSLELPGHIFVLAYDDSSEPARPVAYMETGPLKDSSAHWWIYSVQILRDYRGGPIMARLLTRMINALKKEKFDRIHFFIHKVNPKSIYFYKKMGFLVKKDNYSMFSYSLSATKANLEAPFFKKLKLRWGAS